MLAASLSLSALTTPESADATEILARKGPVEVAQAQPPDAAEKAQKITFVRDVFAVSNVAVDESAESEARAKSIGVANGLSSALVQMMQRITLKNDWSRLPSLPSNQLEGAIRDVSLTDERFGGGRYIASMTVRFKPDRIRSLLSNSGIPYVETVSLPIVAVPILQSGATPQLWEETNLWRQGWSQTVVNQSMAPVIAPLGDLTDLAAMSVQQALGGSRSAVGRFAGRYNGQGVLISIARPSVSAQGGLRVDVNSIARGPGFLEQTEADSFSFESTVPLPEAYARAAQGLFEAHVERWKQENLIRPDQTANTITVNIAINRLADWLAVQRRLQSIGGVKTIRLVELTVAEAIVDLDYIGDVDQLRRALAQGRLSLREDATEQLWYLTASQ